MQITKVLAGVDYATVTLPPDATDADVRQFRESAGRVMAELRRRAPSRVVVTRWYRGESVGGAFSGEGRYGLILQVPGPDGEMVVAEEWPPARHVTRLDVAVTVWYAETDEGVAKRAHSAVCEARAAGAVKGNLKVTLIDGSGAGDTLYVGSRKSSVFLRVYDKGAQSGAESGYGGSWRYEAETKGCAAEDAWTRIVNARSPEGEIFAIVSAEMERKCVPFPCRLFCGDLLRATGDRGSDDVRRLAWLVKQVKPTVKRLVGVFGREVVLAALGLG